MNSRKEVGKRFREVRDELELKQAEMFELLGYKNQGQYSKVESGATYPSIQAYGLMPYLYKIRMSWLMKGEGEKYLTDEEHEKYKAQFEETSQDEMDIMVGYKDRPPSVKSGESAKDIINRIEKDLALLKAKLK